MLLPLSVLFVSFLIQGVLNFALLTSHPREAAFTALWTDKDSSYIRHWKRGFLLLCVSFKTTGIARRYHVIKEMRA